MLMCDCKLEFAQESSCRTFVGLDSLLKSKLFCPWFAPDDWSLSKYFCGDRSSNKAKTALGTETNLQRRHSSVEPGIRAGPFLWIQKHSSKADQKKSQVCFGSGHDVWAQFV